MSENGTKEKWEELAASDADVEALQAKVDELSRQIAQAEIETEASSHTGRRWLVGLLIALGCILLGFGSAAMWVRDALLDTDTWTAVVGPLSQNEVVANTLSTYVVTEIFSEADVQTAVQEALPPEYAVLSGPLVGVLQDLATDTVSTVVQSDQANAVWIAANRTAHELAMEALRGDRSLLYLDEGNLTLDFTGVLGTVEDALRLPELGLLPGDLLPGEEVPGKVVLFTNEQVAGVQQTLSVIDTWGTILPIAALITLVVAWLISLWRRQTLMWIGIGITIVMLLSLLVYAILQPIYLASIYDPVYRLLADEAWDVIFRGYVVQTILLMGLGVLLAVGASLAGPSPTAVSFRDSVGESWSSLTKS